ncbi:hypothetical protein NDU88_001195 [Pleurodeles waltl]|uniref:Uncharacterized protein n=1 Tax=Pleurodeles waltl TaxID=8319 RepID=A0AAV7L8S0_PLEWA|nr:hypothetical protein NDU88_001195 [Pleurodeles waltl]
MTGALRESIKQKRAPGRVQKMKHLTRCMLKFADLRQGHAPVRMESPYPPLPRRSVDCFLVTETDNPSRGSRARHTSLKEESRSCQRDEKLLAALQPGKEFAVIWT